MGVYGADVAQLRDAASEFERAAQSLESITTLLSGELSRAPWHGADATTFRSDWDTDHSRRLTDAATRLRDASRALRTNADDQEVTSSVSGGPGGSAGPGGPGTSVPGPTTGGGGTTTPPGSSTDEDSPNFAGWENGVVEAGDGEVAWRYGLNARGEAEAEVLGGTAKADGEIGAGVKANASGDYSFGESDETQRNDANDRSKHLGDDVTQNNVGIGVGGEASVKAGAYAEGSAEYGNDLGHVGVEGEALAGARADIGGGLTLGPEGAQAGVSAGAFAGAEAKGSVEAEMLGVGGELEAGVRAGIGAEAAVNAQFGVDKVDLELELGLALGVGFSVKPSISFSPKDMADGIMSLF
ncbi:MULTISPECIES: WXG100 family type VII secretion target [Microbacterium]|uniref:WXG100 family type VII secretion target n=1 Tax=Microbacterium trichothecenolyticum TaxID=69370 RepID=A0A0M2HB58_MICTR|nr:MULTISPECIES: hypothetical protein [Microbacterium]KJL43843.1 hypothetical protein RS82_01219 [Microbacterium trichothecenolyticum]MDR7191171.1 hypothetical protein [Microbacterium sp. BE35]